MPGPAGEVYLAGEYNVTYGGVAVGTMEGDAGLPTIEHTAQAEPVANTSRYGKSTLTHFGLGADWFAAFTCLEASPGGAAMSAFWPYGTFGQMGTIARDLFTLSAALVLTSIAGTPASALPSSVTASHAILVPGFATRLVYGPTLRKVPLRLILYPYNLGGGTIGWCSVV